MTDRFALGLGSLIVVAIAADLMTGGGALLFLARWVDAFVEYMAVWR